MEIHRDRYDQRDWPYIKEGKASVLVDGQFGSTGKGLLAAYLASQPHNEVDIATTNASANAGHWTKFKDFPKGDFCCFHLPTFGVIQECYIYLNSGAIINVELLLQEIEEIGIDMGRITIHPNATIISKEDIEEENKEDAQTTKISSTRKGVGEALSRKIKRTAKIAKDIPTLNKFFSVAPLNLNHRLKAGMRVSVEVPQGYSLSLNGPFYPYCTSRNCTVGQGIADAEIHPKFLGPVAMSVRTCPIRVGSIPELGYSGDVYPDQKEISFKQLGVEEELTTVTKRVRRIFTWSQQQFSDALQANRPDLVFLNFCNYVDKQELDNIKQSIMTSCFKELNGCPELLLGWGPEVEMVLRDKEWGPTV